MALIAVSTYLPLPPAEVFARLRKPAVLEAVSAPLLRFTPRGGAFPSEWVPGEYRMGVKLLGLIPLDDQIVGIEELPSDPSAGCYALRDNGRGCARGKDGGGLIRRWDHTMQVEPEGEGTCYTDRVEVDAGALTFAAAGFARLLYTHRQRRWRGLLAAGKI
ncbi:SRPBCC family protein [Alteraurantiacibacter palmitatis]|uniref:SRPBCC family protein n=1 Tax=Alteraurantiacibacter palmitatis TaxID=2054628 RepID=A0ABV7E1C6_9SPHN